ncbi:Nramp family divalent metal transporter [Eudoraea chungangensis]|uniref:Nramp family divalent metal transporter n=1 Tax=Eudoraea chungangensis TaxID=1481905 RepID=UPI0023EC0250|nr:Nramp family divalent metal transporter [Eudoraea chungangensis]
MFKKIGPGVLIAAAFIGPGTITACTLAGVQFQFALLWTVLLSIIATIVLQEMSMRVGIISGKGLSEVIRDSIKNTWVKYFVLAMILCAIVLGNTAYEAGNISGATLGLEVIFGGVGSSLYPLIIGFIAFCLLFLGSYKILERFFVGLVLVMSISFVITALITQPNIYDLLKGLFIPNIPKGGILSIIALVGTTVVPYNLFLHASLAKQKWSEPKEIPEARRDTVLSISLGGMVSLAIIICAASISKGTIEGAADLAIGLEPLYGKSATFLMGIGLFAAGITSAITAPLAAAYVVQSCFGWEKNLKEVKFRIVWMLVLIAGVVSLSTGIKPIVIIQIAQISNGLLLPIIVVLLIGIVNKKSLMGNYVNSFWQNILCGVIVLLILVLATKSIFEVIGLV